MADSQQQWYGGAPQGPGTQGWAPSGGAAMASNGGMAHYGGGGNGGWAPPQMGGGMGGGMDGGVMNNRTIGSGAIGGGAPDDEEDYTNEPPLLVELHRFRGYLGAHEIRPQPPAFAAGHVAGRGRLGWPYHVCFGPGQRAHPARQAGVWRHLRRVPHGVFCRVHRHESVVAEEGDWVLPCRFHHGLRPFAHHSAGHSRHHR